MTDTRCPARRRDGRVCGALTATPSAKFCKFHAAVVRRYGEQAAMEGSYPRTTRKALGITKPNETPTDTITAIGVTATGNGHVAPADIRPSLAAAAARSLEETQTPLLDAALGASREQWVTVQCPNCGSSKRHEISVPDVRSRVAAIELLLREGLGRPAQAEETTPLPRVPETRAAIEALPWSDLQALVLAYPEVENLPEPERKPWLLGRWRGLSKADRDAFRAALDVLDSEPVAV